MVAITNPGRNTPVEGEGAAGAGVRRGLRAGLPLGVAGLVDGLVFGALARQAGLSPAEAALMSGLVCAGTAQFLAIGLWASPLPVFSILATTLGVNLRHLLMGATLRPVLGRSPRRRLFPMLHFLSDESWALATRELRTGSVRDTFFVGAGLVLSGGWIGATLVGATLGQAIRDPARWGLDFTFVAIFAALLAGLWPGRQQALPWVVAALTAIAADSMLPPGWHVLAGGIAGTIVGVVRRER